MAFHFFSDILLYMLKSKVECKQTRVHENLKGGGVGVLHFQDPYWEIYQFKFVFGVHLPKMLLTLISTYDTFSDSL